MDALRIRISQWQLLYRRMKAALLDEIVSDKQPKALFVCAEKSSGPVENFEHETSCTFVKEMEEGAPIAEGLNLLSGFVETVASVVKRFVPIAKDFAEDFAGFAKCIPVVNSALQLVVMCASKAETGMQMMCVKAEWPPTYARLEDLPGAIVKRMIPVLYPDRLVDKLFVKNMLKVQQELTYLSHCK